MAERAPAQQEPVAPSVMLPALVQLSTGHRAQMGHGFALTDPIPIISCCSGRVSAQAGTAPRHSTLGAEAGGTGTAPKRQGSVSGQTGSGLYLRHSPEALLTERLSWVPARASRCESEYERSRREQVTEAPAPSWCWCPSPSGFVSASLHKLSGTEKNTQNGCFPVFSSSLVKTALKTLTAPQKQPQSAAACAAHQQALQGGAA